MLVYCDLGRVGEAFTNLISKYILHKLSLNETKLISKIIDFYFTDMLASHRFSYAEMFQASTNNLLRWKCKACSKEVTNKWHHFYSHATQRSLCPYCPATYSRIDTLRTHLKSKHQSCMRMKNF